MASFTYTAKRHLKTGHSVDTDYTVTLDIQAGDIQPNAVQTVNMSLSGNQVTTVHRLEQTLAITTDYFSASTTPDYDDMEEFIYSTIHGETFTYNDGATDFSVKMQGGPRLQRTGTLFAWSFSIRFL